MGYEIENHVKEMVHSFSGIKSALPSDVLQAPDAEEIINFVTRRGRLRKIWGAARYYNSGLGNGPIKWLDYFRNLWIFQQGATVAREQTEDQADFVPMGDFQLGEANRIHSERWQDRLFMVNGVENKFIEYTPQHGYKFLNLGIIPPGNGAKEGMADLTFTEIAYLGSGLTDATNYGYVVTWWDAVREVESLPWGALVGESGLWDSFSHIFALSQAAVTSGADKANVLDLRALKAAGYDADRVTHFIIYRWTQADNFTFKRLTDPGDTFSGSIEIHNDFYTDIIAEADLGAVLDESLSPPPSGLRYEDSTSKSNIGPRFVKFFRDQLWLFGVNYPGTPNGFRANADGSSASVIDFFPQNGIAYASEVSGPDYWKFDYDVGRSTGQRDTGIAKHRNTLIFFKEKSAYYLDGSSPDDYSIKELDVQRGITVPGSIAETTLGPIGLGAEGFTLFDSVAGGNVISEELTDFVERINLDAADCIYAIFDRKEEKYECHVPLDAFTWNSHVFSYDCKIKTWQLTRRAAGAGTYGISSSKRVVGLLGDPRNGKLYDVNDYSRVTFDGQTIHAKWRSKAFDFGDPGAQKTVQMVEIMARGVTDFRLSVDLIVDFGQADSSTATEEDIPPDVRGDKWAENQADDNGMKWDSGQWSKGCEKKTFTILIQGTGKKFNLVIRNSDKDANRASFEIEGVILHASMLSGDKDE